MKQHIQNAPESNSTEGFGMEFVLNIKVTKSGSTFKGNCLKNVCDVYMTLTVRICYNFTWYLIID